MPLHYTTALYDLITAIHSVTESNEDALVVALLMHWMRTGSITGLDAISALPADCQEEDITMGTEVLPPTCMVG